MQNGNNILYICIFTFIVYIIIYGVSFIYHINLYRYTGKKAQYPKTAN